MPYRYDRTVVIVPNNNISTLFLLQNIVRSTIFIIWIGISLTFMLLRKLFQNITKSPYMPMVKIFFDSLGLLIGTASGSKVFNRPERILTLWLSIFAVLTSLLFSGFLFQQMAGSSKASTINNLKDLEKTKLKLYVFKPGAASTKKALG